MMNQVSINVRGVFPKESLPAEILDYQLIFFGAGGMACALANKGKSFHGVLHKCTEKEMDILDKMEGIYKRVKAVARLYDGKVIDCTVYADPDGIIDRSNDKPPGERYIEIMVEGCNQYGVQTEHIQWLQKHST